MAFTKEEYELTLLNEILEPFLLAKDTLLELKGKIDVEIHKGLNRSTNNISDIKCYPTWLHDLPTGCEHGMFVTVALYPTHFYVTFTHLKGQNNYQIESERFDISEKDRTTHELCDFFVQKIVSVIERLQLQREPLPVALVISGPLYHINLSSAVLLKKIAHTPFFENKDIPQLMKEALKSTTKAHLDLVAVLNDATAVFVSSAWRNTTCKISGVFGDGINLAYWENIKNIEIIDKPIRSSHMLVNTEVGNFGNHGQLEFIQTPYDFQAINEGGEIGNYMFEKMIGGNYIGEIIRKVIVKAVEAHALFDGTLSKGLLTKNCIKYEQVLTILSEKHEYYNTPLIFDKLGITSPSKFECDKVFTIVEAVTMRSAYLFAAALAAVVDLLDVKQTELPIVIGMEGSIYSSLPIYQTWIEDKLKELITTDRTVQLVNSLDENGRGAAILSAIALRKNYIYEQIDNLNLSDNTDNTDSTEDQDNADNADNAENAANKDNEEQVAKAN